MLIWKVETWNSSDTPQQHTSLSFINKWPRLCSMLLHGVLILPECTRAAGLRTPVSVYACFCNITIFVIFTIFQQFLHFLQQVWLNSECLHAPVAVQMLWSEELMKHLAELETKLIDSGGIGYKQHIQ